MKSIHKVHLSTVFATQMQVIDTKYPGGNILFNLQVIDALELAFQELDSEDSVTSAKGTKEEMDFDVDKKISVTPMYENIDIFYRNPVDGDFPLDMPTNVMEPPKEKPPPPPTEDNQDDELLGNVSTYLRFDFSYLNSNQLVL